MPEEINMSYVVSRGLETGVILRPHLHEDGKYVASVTRFEKDYARVESLRELAIPAKHGFSIRMSCADSTQHKAPSLISPASLEISAAESP